MNSRSHIKDSKYTEHMKIGGETVLLEWISKAFNAVKSNAEAIMAIVAVLTLMGAFIAFLLKLRSKRKTSKITGNGGNGGNARVGGSGEAIGGRGGRGGLTGSGGHGGGAEVVGDGFVIGGDGGDSGVFWRPALGAPSVMEHQVALGNIIWSDAPRDDFGFYVVGRGGNGGDISASVMVDGYCYPLIPLLQLLRLWAPHVLDAADATRPAGPQDFWEIVTQLDPSTAKAAEEHTRQCLDVTMPQKRSAPDPYLRILKSDKNQIPSA